MLAAAVANAETGLWRHHGTESALESVDYLLLDAEVEERIWTLVRRCDLKEAWIQSSASHVGEALDYNLSYVRWTGRDWVRYYKTRIRRDEQPIMEWTWRYGYNEDFGVESLTLWEPSSIDKLLLGDRFAMEISAARGVAVFDTTGFGEALNTFCPTESVRHWTQRPVSLVGTGFKGGNDVRPLPPREDQTGALSGRVAIANREGKNGIALQVQDPYDWHDVRLYIKDKDGEFWSFQWSGFDGDPDGDVKTAHIPFEHFRRHAAKRYWGTGQDEIDRLFIIGWIPVSRKSDYEWSGGWSEKATSDSAFGSEPEAARLVIDDIQTVTWEEANNWTYPTPQPRG